MSLLQLIAFLVFHVLFLLFFLAEFNNMNLTLLTHMWKILETNQSQGLKWGCRFPCLSLSPPLSAPLFKKRSVLLSNSERKKHPEILTCLIALIIFTKILIQSYDIPLILFAVYKCNCTCHLRQKETRKQSLLML